MSDQNGKLPLTSKQFISFETIAAVVFGLFVAVAAWTWTSRVSNVDTRFEKMDSKLDKIVVSLAKIETRLDALTINYGQTRETSSENKQTLARLDERVKNLEK